LGAVPDNGVQAHLVVRSLKLLYGDPPCEKEVYVSELSSSLFLFSELSHFEKNSDKKLNSRFTSQRLFSSHRLALKKADNFKV